MANFMQRDPTNPDFWDERFEKKFMPWDKGDVPQDFRDFVAARSAALRCLIPGCGNAYEVALLAERGWDVTAIDFSPAAVQSAQLALGSLGKHIVQADFFTYVPKQPLELIYERAFFCALPPDLRQQIVNCWSQLLSADGLLAGYFFFDDAADASKKGPPFSIHRERWKELLEPYFELLEDSSVSDSIPVFAGKERWQVWRRR
ncbi:methyltransferase domain-containing protein [Undibacterium jejuense]|uniref:Methyltransferase domain-containing protein n=1 Tax=Undibacterium jejuense TaxID=1344949 RepID=A0A923HM34_9BURK|nr:methyltransferase [Undibacterium jejuense]MBC3861188.1 methyltransferase domain-containing protein [Undibacterium jejuense]